MTKRTFAVLAGMMLVASLAVAGCSASEEVTVDDIIVDEVTEEVTTDMMEEEMTEEVTEPVVMEEVSTEEAAE